jgi:hypothetical protein
MSADPQILIYPGPALPNLQERQLTPAGAATLRRLAEAAGLAQRPPDTACRRWRTRRRPARPPLRRSLPAGRPRRRAAPAPAVRWSPDLRAGVSPFHELLFSRGAARGWRHRLERRGEPDSS